MLGTLAALSGIVQLGTGIWQAIQSGKQSEVERPKYETPKEVGQATNIASQLAYGTMPGYGEAMSNIQQQEASQVSKIQNAADSGSDVLGSITSLNLGTNRNIRNLDAANTQFKSTALRGLQGQLMNQATYSDKEQQYNVIQPYEEAMAASSVLGEGAIQNIAGAANTSIGNYMSYKVNQDWMKSNDANTDALNGILKKIMGGQNTDDKTVVDQFNPTGIIEDANSSVNMGPSGNINMGRKYPYYPAKQFDFSPFIFGAESYYNNIN